MVDADKEYHDNRLEELNQKSREAHNKLVAVVNSNGEQLKKAIDAFNGKFATTDFAGCVKSRLVPTEPHTKIIESNE